MGEKSSSANRRVGTFGKSIGRMLTAFAMLMSFGKNTRKGGKSGLVQIDNKTLAAGMPPDVFGSRYKANQRKIRRKIRSNPNTNKYA